MQWRVADVDPWLYVIMLLATSGLTLLHLVVAVGIAGFQRLRRGKAESAAPVDPSAPAPSLTFLVPVYNDGLTIGPCVESILRQTRPADEVIVVDDGSTDETPRVLAGFAERGVKVLRMPENGGKTRAIEEGLRHVRTELVAITDADSIVHQDYVKEVVESFRDPRVAGVGGAVESIPHTWVTAARQVEYLITLEIDRNAEDKMGTLIVLPGVSSTYRTKVLQELGFEHDTIAEDFDLTFRMHKAGHQLRMNPRALVYTSDPPTLKAYHSQLVRWYTDLWITVKKHRDMWGRKLFGAVEVPWLVVNMLVYSLFIICVPIVLLFWKPEALLIFFAWELAADTILSVTAAIVYKRWDPLWGILSRLPTRFVARWVTLTTLVRVLAGRPGLAWTKLERRRTDRFLASRAARSPT